MSKRIVYCTPSLYIAGGIERVLTTKANYFADVLGYEIYIILTDGKDKPPYYPLSPKIKLIQLDINFEELWHLSFIKKTIVYLKKQLIYKKKLSQILAKIKPDITISLLRREINFITSLKDGSIKIGELHVNRNNYRNFEVGETNFIKEIFSKLWMKNLISHIKKLDKFVVLTEEDKENWVELSNIVVIPNPLPIRPQQQSNTTSHKVIAVGRYTYQKGFDLLIDAWALVNKHHPDWELFIYGNGNKEAYIKQCKRLEIETTCHICDAVTNINDKYAESSIFVLSSRFEGFGMVIIEAMACGVPSVSFTCPCGPKDIINNNIDGLLIDNGNIEEFANGICKLIENPQKRIFMGQQAIQHIERYYIENIANKWKDLFNTLLIK